MKRARKHDDDAATPYVYVGAGDYGQHVVDDSPGYGKGARAKRRTGICILQAARRGGPLREVGFWPGVEIGWIEHHADHGCLFATGEDGRLHALKIMVGGALREFSSADTLGGSCHLELSPDGRHALVANYGAALLAVLSIGADGRLGPATDSKLHWAEPPTEAAADRQDDSHPHQVKFAPGGRFVLACDLGADRVWVYEFDASRGALVGAANSERHMLLPPSSGPRHLAIHSSGRFVFVLCELSGDIISCSWDGASGRLRPTAHVASVLPAGVTCSRAHHSGTSHILCSADGTRVYAASRTDNAIVTFAVNQRTGSLTKLQSVSTRGICPRNFDLSPSKLRVLNQDSHNLVEFDLRSDGTLADDDDHDRSTRRVVVTPLAGVCGQVLCEVPAPSCGSC